MGEEIEGERREWNGSPWKMLTVSQSCRSGRGYHKESTLLVIRLGGWLSWMSGWLDWKRRMVPDVQDVSYDVAEVCMGGVMESMCTKSDSHISQSYRFSSFAYTSIR